MHTSYSDFHLFFDLDRTLWDFDKNSEDALKSIFGDFKTKLTGTNFYQFHGVYKIENAKLWTAYAKGKLNKETLRYKRFENTFKELGCASDELIQQFGDEYVRRSPFQKKLVDGSLETIHELSKMKFNLHIITNGFKEVQYIKLENCGLRPYFNQIICSEEVGFNKPNEQIFQYALDKTGAKADNSLMIGDDYHADIHGAISAGWKAIYFNPGVRKSYGFNSQFSNYKDFIPLLLKTI